MNLFSLSLSFCSNVEGLPSSKAPRDAPEGLHRFQQRKVRAGAEAARGTLALGKAFDRLSFGGFGSSLRRSAGTGGCGLIRHLLAPHEAFPFWRGRAGLGAAGAGAAGVWQSPFGASGSLWQGAGFCQGLDRCLRSPSQLDRPFLSLRVRHHHKGTQETTTLAKSRGSSAEDPQNSSC